MSDNLTCHSEKGWFTTYHIPYRSTKIHLIWQQKHTNYVYWFAAWQEEEGGHLSKNRTGHEDVRLTETGESSLLSNEAPCIRKIMHVILPACFWSWAWGVWMIVVQFSLVVANEETLLRKRLWIFPVCPRAQQLLRTQNLHPRRKKCFQWETFCFHIKCFASRSFAHRQETLWATMFPQ